MKKILFLVFVLTLASCSQQDSAQTPTQSGNAEQNSATQAIYPSTVVDSPAAKFCESKGGKNSVEKREDGFEMLYCEVAGEKKDAWQFMNDNA